MAAFSDERHDEPCSRGIDVSYGRSQFLHTLVIKCVVPSKKNGTLIAQVSSLGYTRQRGGIECLRQRLEVLQAAFWVWLFC
jgi:hypothetical protein